MALQTEERGSKEDQVCAHESLASDVIREREQQQDKTRSKVTKRRGRKAPRLCSLQSQKTVNHNSSHPIVESSSTASESPTQPFVCLQERLPPLPRPSSLAEALRLCDRDLIEISRPKSHCIFLSFSQCLSSFKRTVIGGSTSPDISLHSLSKSSLFSKHEVHSSIHSPFDPHFKRPSFSNNSSWSTQ